MDGDARADFALVIDDLQAMSPKDAVRRWGNNDGRPAQGDDTKDGKIEQREPNQRGLEP
jgi:hypothetical protein